MKRKRCIAFKQSEDYPQLLMPCTNLAQYHSRSAEQPYSSHNNGGFFCKQHATASVLGLPVLPCFVQNPGHQFAVDMDHLTRGDLFLACFAAAATVGAAILAVLVGFHLQNRKDKRDTDTKLSLLLVEHPLHSHDEKTPYAKPTDVLTVEGIRYPRKANGSV